MRRYRPHCRAVLGKARRRPETAYSSPGKYSDYAAAHNGCFYRQRYRGQYCPQVAQPSHKQTRPQRKPLQLAPINMPSATLESPSANHSIPARWRFQATSTRHHGPTRRREARPDACPIPADARRCLRGAAHATAATGSDSWQARWQARAPYAGRARVRCRQASPRLERPDHARSEQVHQRKRTFMSMFAIIAVTPARTGDFVS